ncbi:hypothetical protein VIAE109791_14145 [Vibrio aestuarianus subsp. francensis]
MLLLFSTFNIDIRIRIMIEFDFLQLFNTQELFIFY